MANIFLVKKPWITEKATMLSSGRAYVFLVEKSANKNEIKKAVKEMYKVDPVKVNMVTIPAKSRGAGRIKGMKPSYKKAVVTVKTGQSIDLQ